MTSAYMGFIVTRTLPATYVYGIYRHAPSYWNDSMRFRIIVYTHVTMATGSIYIYIYTNMMPESVCVLMLSVLSCLVVLLLTSCCSWLATDIASSSSWSCSPTSILTQNTCLIYNLLLSLFFFSFLLGYHSNSLCIVPQDNIDTWYMMISHKQFTSSNESD